MSKTKPSMQSSFQLPDLDISSDSLTAGTDIPAPATTPPFKPSTAMSDTPPQTPTSPHPLRSHPTSNHSLSRAFTLDAATNSPAPNAPIQTSSPAVSPAVRKKPMTPTTSEQDNRRTSTAANMTPPPAKRPLSVRKFLGLRSLSGAFGRSSMESNESGLYTNGKARNSTDKLSSISPQYQRPESQASVYSPSLKKKRSSLMMLGKRGSSFLGLSVDEEPENEGNRENGPVGSKVSDKKKTPPPTLPGLEGLKASRGLKDDEGDYLGGGDMFKNIG